MREIYIIGIGMGNPNTIMVNGRKNIETCSVLIGARRMVDSFIDEKKQAVYAINPKEILNWIVEHEEVKNVAVLMSGDLGFFSGANKLRELIIDKYGSVYGDEQLKFEYISGISSLSYFSAAVGMSWEDMKVVSLHGRDGNDGNTVLNNKKTFFLTDGKDNTVKKICGRLEKTGLGQVKVFVGEKLSYEDEKITEGTASELSKIEFEPLSVMIVLNNHILQRKKDTLGIRDDEFIRGDVPMTKEEIRTIAVSKLNLKETDTVYDIGAGTGSVSVEIALACREGSVYAIETNLSGVALIETNKINFNTANLHIIKGMAPESLRDLPMPNKAFVGGSKGNLEDIIEMLISKNPDIRIVIDVVALESLGETMNCIKKYGFKDVDITQLSVSKAKTLGKYNLMIGQNPVYIISVQGL